MYGAVCVSQGSEYLVKVATHPPHQSFSLPVLLYLPERSLALVIENVIPIAHAIQCVSQNEVYHYILCHTRHT